MEDNTGWIGNVDQVLYTLGIMGADKDENGQFLVYGEAPISFMGAGQEMVISAKCEYSVKGQRVSLVGALCGTSYGQAVTVI